jgi:pilus assembly protein FimV
MTHNTSVRTWLAVGALSLLPMAAYPAGLGKLTVTSSLGQPLRAEIEVIADAKEDVASITARMASQDAFKEARIERAAVLSGVKFSVEKRASGETYLKISSVRPIDDPFLDMLIELNWSSGRLLREYTVLLDPPGFAEQQPVAPLAVPSVPAQAVTPAAKVEAAVVPKQAPVAQAPAPSGKRAPSPAERTFPKAKPEQPPAVARQAETGQDTYGPVRKGDTLTQIAADMLETSPEGVSLEQMLVGLYERNKGAFVGNNMNRLKTGQILHVPEADKLSSLSRKEAAREIKLHAADWNAYRQKLAGAVAEATPEKGAAKQTATGKITSKVEEKVAAQAEPAKDVLKLSKGEAVVAGKSGAGVAGKESRGLQDRIRSLEEEATAREKTVNEANERIAALEKNIQQMQQLLEIKSKSLAELQSQSAAKPPAPVAAPVPSPVEPAPPVAEVQPAPVVEPAPPAPLKPVEPAAKPKPAVVAPPAQPEPSWYEEIFSNPLYLGSGVAAILIGGLLWLMAIGKRRRKSLTTFEDSIMTGGDLKANTVFGEATGGVIDTGDTSFLTDFSQAGLGTIDTNDVDPIAEAEVYMAYGRDAQAEEILKEAMHKDPSRHEIQVKLLEIYAGRKNVIAFETLASELYAAVGGQASPLWEKVSEMGRQLDPDNPLYSGGAPAASAAKPAESRAGGEEAVIGGVLATEAAAQFAPAAEVEEEMEEPLAESDEPHFDLPAESTEVAMAGPELPAESAEAAADEAALEFDLDLAVPPSSASEATEPAVPAMEALEAEMGLTLDLDTIIPQAVEKQSMLEPSAPEAEAETVEAVEAVEAPDLEEALAFDLAGVQEVAPSEGAAASELEEPEITVEEPQESPLDFDFGLDDEPQAGAGIVVEEPHSQMDFTGLSLDLDEAPVEAEAPAEAAEGVDDQWQQVSTKLDLAKAYIEMGDKEGAREILQEVLQEGDSQQQDDAKALVSGLA